MINIIKDLYNNIWYGEIGEYNKYINGNSDENLFFYYLESFKSGNFKEIDKFLDFICKCENEIICKASLKLFFLVANNNDLLNPKLEKIIYDKDIDFFFLGGYIKSSLSLNCIKYLLDIFSDIEGTEEGENILFNLGCIIDYEPAIETYCDYEEIEEECENFIKENNINKYYYESYEICLKYLLEQLMEDLIYCKENNKNFTKTDIPFILSINTGIKCPIHYNIVVNDKIIDNVKEYSENILKLNFQNGNKYFYGNKL